MDFLATLLASIFNLIPSRKSRTINKNLRLLKKEEEFIQIVNKIGKLFIWKSEIREFLYEQPIPNILDDAEKKASFFKDFEKLCEKVGI